MGILMFEASLWHLHMIGRDFFCCCFWVLYLQDQYVNHIVNETGATVLLRGRGSGNPESVQGEGSVPYDHLGTCIFWLTRKWHLTWNVLMVFLQDSNHCTCYYHAVIQKVLSMQSFWLKIFWIQFVPSVGPPGTWFCNFCFLYWPHYEVELVILSRRRHLYYFNTFLLVVITFLKP